MDEAARHCAAMMEAMHGAQGAAAGDWGGMMGGMGGMGDMGSMLAFGLLWLLIIAAFAALLIVGAIWLWRRGQPAPTPAAPSPRETLDRRYAAGEVERETYLQMRSDLGASS
jgi:putative membrane protein